jgi:hypothetical protein
MSVLPDFLLSRRHYVVLVVKRVLKNRYAGSVQSDSKLSWIKVKEKNSPGNIPILRTLHMPTTVEVINDNALRVKLGPSRISWLNCLNKNGKVAANAAPNVCKKYLP